MRPIKMGNDKTEKEIANEVVIYANNFFDFFDENEVIFNEETCSIIQSIKEKYYNVWQTYSMKEIMGDSATGDLRKKLVYDMQEAYDKTLKIEMQKLKKELRDDFRKKLGIIE